jgi:hypothetical protein
MVTSHQVRSMPSSCPAGLRAGSRSAVGSSER